ncbi:conserved Plasmodium protein, unknown function [Plasmodium ovale curtisi]|uniref:Uncharacterized protein n=1 Tax=Plasmodium ovale curtisi TaxID=864141 RepID=A0A1A8WWC9_PLAOA|nr:conserved Plasmodium protein, unknown function [Plasmodium ovale curtisi]
MNARKSVVMKVYYQSSIHYKYYAHYKNEKSGKVKNIEWISNRLTDDINYYSRNEKKQILKKIYKNITLKRNKLKEELLQFYLNDKDIKKIFEEEKISDENSKVLRINKVENNEEVLINKFNSFYDLFHFSIEKVRRKSNVCITWNVPIVGENAKGTYDSNRTLYEKHELVINNLEIIKKYVVFIDKNLTTYENTSASFKLCFCLHKFIIYFFNYSFPFINYFDHNLLMKYTYLYIKLNLLENSIFFYEQKKKKSGQIYFVNISDEDIFYITKNNNNNTLKLLLLLSNQKGHHDLMYLSELYFLYIRKIKIYELVRNISDCLFADTRGASEEREERHTLEKEHIDAAIGRNDYERVVERNGRINDVVSTHYNYFICLYFNLLLLLNRTISNCVLFLPKCNRNLLHLLDCVGLLCEGVFEEDKVSQRKISHLYSFVSNNYVEKYVLKCITKETMHSNSFVGNKTDENRVKKHIYDGNEILFGKIASEQNAVAEVDYHFADYRNVLGGDGMSCTKRLTSCIEMGLPRINNVEINKGSVHINQGGRKNCPFDLQNHFNEGEEIWGENLNRREVQLLKRNLFYEECFLKLYRNTRKSVKFLFENMTHFFILQDCDFILKFLQVIHVTRCMDAYIINVLFYSVWLNAEFLKTYQIKNVLFFLSLFKSNFVIKNVNLQRSIYNSYNKQLIFFLRKKIEIYFENNSLEKSIKSIFLLSDLLSYNKVIKKIFLKKLTLLNFDNISPSLFCQIFFLSNKLRFDASNRIFCELFLKHYKRTIYSLTYLEILDLIKNMEYLINKKKRRIFVVMILHFFRKLQQVSVMSNIDKLPISINNVFKLINIINKFKLYEYCKRDYFRPMYHFLFTTNCDHTDIKKDGMFYVHEASHANPPKCSHYSFIIRNGKTMLLDTNYVYKKERRKDVLLQKKSVINSDMCAIDANVERRKGKENMILEKSAKCVNVSRYIRTKLELLTVGQILDLIFFSINTHKNIFLISELHADLFYRIVRNAYFSRNEISLSFRSMWMSRVFHLNLFESLVDIITNNKKIVDSSIFALDVLLCFCSYKHDKMYEPLIISLFDICFEDMDKILKNIKKQIHFYYCFIFLEVYYPLLFLKVTKKERNILATGETNPTKWECKKEVNAYANIIKNGLSKIDGKKDKYDKVIFRNPVQGRDNIYIKMGGKNEHRLDNHLYSSKNISKKEEDVIPNSTNTMLEMESINTTHTVDILKYIKQLFFLQQKKRAYSYDLVKFYEILEKLNITKIKFNNVPNVFFKNYEMDNLFVLNVFFPVLKFSILFTKEEIDSKSAKKIGNMVKISNCSTPNGFLITGDDAYPSHEENALLENTNEYTNHLNGANHVVDVDESNVGIGSTSRSEQNYVAPNSLFQSDYENGIDILAPKLYMYKNYKINVMVIPVEKVTLFFKTHNLEKQNSIVNESNAIFDEVYHQMLRRKKGDKGGDTNMLTALIVKQLQFIFHLN